MSVYIVTMKIYADDWSNIDFDNCKDFERERYLEYIISDNGIDKDDFSILKVEKE